MDRQVYTQNDQIKLLYAEDTDRRFIYDMAFEDEAIWRSMLERREDFPWSELRDSEDYFFSGAPGRDKYLLIEYEGEIVGTISHTYNNGKIPNFELDMWLRSAEYAGLGIGSTVMKMLIDRLVQDHGIKTFIIRPWIKNPRAVRAYEKCGFTQREDFVPSDYYGKYLEEYGDGDYPSGETVNMVLEINR